MGLAAKPLKIESAKPSRGQMFFRRLPIVRSLGLNSPPYHIGSVIENRLGLQIGRAIGKQIARKLRKSFWSPDIQKYLDVLQRDGVLAIENFLPDEEFKNVLAEFERATEGVSLTPYKNVENAKLYRLQLAQSASPEDLSSIRKNFQENDLLNRLAAAVVRREITGKPDVLLDTYQNLNNSGIDNDIENILHADLHVPTVKMFFYLTRTDHRNGAFIYAKGSQKLTAARLIHEYELSVREAKLRQGMRIPEQLLERRAEQVRNIIKPSNYRRLKIEETQFCVEPNTMLIANNMGFHRRGEFHVNEPRKAILINYRKVEKLFR
jgi:hypothetical protein